ncbi:MAG TPA: efflux RND transporter periplasmic adaptor subunit [Candidatus Polarisedimenticolaceae bacterium]|nr:efflux RND transporter periplasmic adaptor subunit [Candidatus Polarisedimenticolaceae bacterium]
MKRKILISVLAVVAIVVVLGGLKTLQIMAMIKNGAAFTQPAETVTATDVKQETWESLLHAVGSVTAVHGVVLKAELAGTVLDIAFESGAKATKGQVLVKLDTSLEEAQLKSAEAQAELARLNFERAKDLKKQGVISQSDYDASEASFRSTASQADTIRATIGKKTIRAPFSGQLGIRSVNLGQYVDAGAEIVSLNSLDPVYVDFNLPEQQAGQLKKSLGVRITADAAPGASFEGKVTAFNPDVNASTRNVKVQATVPNASGALRPGMFARVQVVLPESQSLLIIPQTAVLHAPYGDSVFVINDVKDEKSGQSAKQVQMTTVRLGETRGDFVAVTQGLKAGQTVVSSGVFKLRNGATVAVDNSLAPEARTAPKPPNS